MSFERRSTVRWHKEVPGSRWFKADLHIHTIDDLPGGRAKMPAEVQGNPSDPEVLREYARAFLRGAVRAGVEVLGLTPHAVRLADDPATSAVWHIVDAWNEEDDEDEVPFREKIYGVFPGFEPSFKDGKAGLHLLFLFDPEVGRARYLDLFSVAMGGVAPWKNQSLQISNRGASEFFDDLRQHMDREAPRDSSGQRPWDVLVLAPHVDSAKGLFGAKKAQILQRFRHSRVAGLELPDNQLPTDQCQSRPWLPDAMQKYRQAFFHASDAYKVSKGDDPEEHEVGNRTTFVKLASPRIEALRQAFIASESRLRIAYERKDGSLRPLDEPPDSLHGSRPWLRRTTVRGKAAFFGGEVGGEPREVTVNLNPDLTCIIGGSMTGKSTLLDGLRVHVGAGLPVKERLRKDVEARGEELFLAGKPEITLDTPRHPVGTLHERWPAVFFSQNELESLAQDPAIEGTLARLAPGESKAIEEREARLSELDAALAERAREIGTYLEKRSEAEQLLSEARDAKTALDVFKEAGLATMQQTEELHGTIARAREHAAEVRRLVDAIGKPLDGAAIPPDAAKAIRERLESMDEPGLDDGLTPLQRRAMAAVQAAQESVPLWSAAVDQVEDALRRAVRSDREAVEKDLAERGYGAEKLRQFQGLSSRAGSLSTREAAFRAVESKLAEMRDAFDRDRGERGRAVEQQRTSFERVGETVQHRFGGKIRVRRIDRGRSDDLEEFLLGFKQKGITQWWRSLDEDERPSPAELLEKLEADRLADVGASTTVAQRLQEALSEEARYRLQALRSPDRFVLEYRVRDGEYRELDRLSGGRRVSLLLSLLLQAQDERPLVIDQPEDQLDHGFLWETVLPALRRLKGRRQVIVATHDANIAVNGDADLVVQLEADADHGRVAVAGAIEDPAVREAIIETVDGGAKAFELRKAKYGF